MKSIDLEQANIKPLPIPDADTQAYWDGLKVGKLLLQHCVNCGNVQFYQQSVCRKCSDEKLVHRPASGRGKVHSFSVVYRAPGPAFKEDTPYAVLLVELEEGPRMISSLVEGNPMSVDFDMEVEIVFDPINDEIILPKFRPV